MRTCKWLAIVMLAACGGGGKKAAKTEPVAETTPPATTEPAKTEASAPVPTPKKEEPPPMTMAQKIDKTSKAFLQGWNSHDVDMILAQYDADATFSLPGVVELKGRDAIKGPIQGELTSFPDFKAGVSRVIMKDNVAVLEWVVTGTNTGDAPDHKATKRSVGVHGVDVMTFTDAGLIKEDRRYYDAGTEMMQLDAKAKKGSFRPVADAPSGDPAMIASAGSDDEKKNLEVIDQRYKAFDDHKADAILAVTDKDVEVEDYTDAATVKGAASYKKSLGTILKAIPDLKQDRTSQIAAGNVVVIEGVLKGTLKGKIGNMKPTNKPTAMHFLDIAEVKDGKIARFTTYTNTLEGAPQPAPKADAKKADGKKEEAKKPAK